MYPRLRRACLLALCVVGSPTGANAQENECYDAEYGAWRPVPSESEVRSMPPGRTRRLGERLASSTLASILVGL